MTSAPLFYAVLSGHRWGRAASAVREPNPAPPRGFSSTTPAELPAHPVPPLRPSTSSTARVRLNLEPGQKGTKHLLAEYADRLICVRYRYDPKRGKRLKTVELVVVERDWQPPRFAPDHIVALRIAFAEVEVRDLLKQAGAGWNPQRRVWQLRYDRVAALGLTTRIADDAGI
jgi:hypothetical protein